MAFTFFVSQRRPARRLVVGLAVLGLMAGTAAAAPANAAPGRNDITAHTRHESYDSGQQFIVRGLVTINGHASRPGRLVKIQSSTASGWRDLPGVQVRTNSDGRYRVRVILFQDGERVLRAVGKRPGNVPNLYERFTVCIDCDFDDV